MSSQYKKKLLRYVFDPFKDVKIRRGEKTKALRDAVEALEDQILNQLGDGKSPVAGEKWKRSLSKEYKEKKKTVSSSTIANMELFGGMLDALNVRIFGNSKIAVEIKGDEAEKADGHNQLTGRKSKTTRRRFIPGERQRFNKKVTDTISDVTDKYVKKDGDD